MLEFLGVHILVLPQNIQILVENTKICIDVFFLGVVDSHVIVEVDETQNKVRRYKNEMCFDIVWCMIKFVNLFNLMVVKHGL